MRHSTLLADESRDICAAHPRQSNLVIASIMSSLLPPPFAGFQKKHNNVMLSFCDHAS
jgi:hypothetical protein